MKKGVILENLILPLLVLILAPSFSAIGSQLATGNWITWIESVPVYVWIIFVILIIIWIVVVLIYKRFKKIRERPGLGFGGGNYLGRIENIGHVENADVKWKLYANKSNRFDTIETVPIDNIEAELTPRCPNDNCNTELEQQRSFWGGYVWSCPRCDFKKRNKDSFGIESDRASRIARSDFENNRTVSE